MDEFRIYNGTAKYTSNFTVKDPTDMTALPTTAPTLKIQNRYNNTLKEYTVQMTSDNTRMALTGSN